MRKDLFCVQSTDGKNTLHIIVWEPEQKAKGIVQISHGMIEYMERYEEFALYLNNKGFVVVGNDHLGHGQTAGCDEDLGYFGTGRSKTVVDDLYEVTKFAKKEYGSELPYFLFGHSMGSFMARRYLMTYGRELTGAIISGTGYTPGPALCMGSFLAGAIGKIKGERYRSPLIKKIGFGGYNKRIPDAKTPNDWLSKNEENINKYCNDKFCSFEFTIDGYKTLFGVLKFIQKPENYRKIPKDLPIFFIAGKEDPVGNYGKGVLKVFYDYKAAGVQDIKKKLYEGDRHELTNELDRDVVYRNIYTWLKRHMEL